MVSSCTTRLATTLPISLTLLRKPESYSSAGPKIQVLLDEVGPIRMDFLAIFTYV